MYLITRKNDNVIAMSSTIAEMDESYNRIRTGENTFLTPASDFHIYEVDDSFAFESNKQCFDGETLTDNPNYIAPPPTTEEQILQLKTDLDNAIMELTMAIATQRSAV